MEAPTTTTAPAAALLTAATAAATATTVTWYFHYSMSFKMWSLHSLSLWIFMKYIGAFNAYVDKGVILVHTT